MVYYRFINAIWFFPLSNEQMPNKTLIIVRINRNLGTTRAGNQTTKQVTQLPIVIRKHVYNKASQQKKPNIPD